jgi:hypothetical protein
MQVARSRSRAVRFIMEFRELEVILHGWGRLKPLLFFGKISARLKPKDCYEAGAKLSAFLARFGAPGFAQAWTDECVRRSMIISASARVAAKGAGVFSCGFRRG